MIEMIYKGNAKSNGRRERRGLPKNIRQIGEAGKEKRIYIEDYAATFLERTACAVLLGEVWQNGTMKCFFIDGALKVEPEEFGDAMWEKVYAEARQYFQGAEILGWASRAEEPEEEPEDEVLDLHREQFPGEDQILLLHGENGETSVYLAENAGIKKQNGYCVYYEKNEQMQNYMIQKNEGKSVDAEEEIPDRAIQNFRKRFAEKMEKAGQEAKEAKEANASLTVRFLYGASMFLVLTILVIGVTMINNVNRMRDMEAALSEMAQTEAEKQTEALAVSAQVREESLAEGAETEMRNQGGKEPKNTEAKTQEAMQESESGQPILPNGNIDGTSEYEKQTETGNQENTGAALEGTDRAEQTEETKKMEEMEQTEETEQSANRAATEASSARVQRTQAEYTVREGDTLATVCRMYYGNLDMLEEICNLNEITDPNTILPGQKLVLP